MLEFFKNLDTFQIMLLLGAAALFAPELLEKLKGFLKDAAVKNEDESVDPVDNTDPDSPPKPTPKPEPEPESFVELVGKWDCFYTECEERGLKEACDALKEVFPTLLNARKK